MILFDLVTGHLCLFQRTFNCSRKIAVKTCKRNDLDDAIEQTLAFDSAVREALEFAQSDGNTLVVATADHETGAMALVGGAPDASTLEVAWTTKGHTAATVPLYAYGPGALHFSGFHDNTELPVLMARLLKVENFPRQQVSVAD